MKSGNNIEFRVGLIVLLCIVLVAGSLYWLQGYRLEINSVKYQVLFNDVGTLAVGDRVTVSGVKKGKVSDLDLTQNGVLVELQIYKDVVIKRDATFKIRNMGLMGERFIAINPGKSDSLFNTSVIATGGYDYGIPEVMGALGEMVSELKKLVATLHNTVASDSSLSRFNRIVDNLESVSGSMAGYLERNETKLDQTAENFVKATANLRDILARNDEKIDSTVTKFNKVGSDLEHLVAQLDTLSQSARRFADRVENGEGTLQLMIDDRRLYDDLRQTADNLDDLILDIRENPRKYINLKVELF